MARLACVDIPYFSLQVLFRERPEWRELPAAVVDRDEPTGRLLSVNEAASTKGIRAGLSYSQGLSLSGDLRAAPVRKELIEEARARVVELLSAFTPEAEACRLAGDGEAVGGAFWLNVAGLGRLYTSLSAWARTAMEGLASDGFSAVIAVGFTRFGSYVVARSRRKTIVLQDRGQEESLMRRAALRVLPLPPDTLLLLERLGIETVGAFLDLPEAGVAKRFGRDAHGIFLWAQTERLPIQPVAIAKDATIERRFDDAISNLTLLTAALDDLLDELFDTVARKGRLVASLTIELLEGAERRAEELIRPAAPTRDAAVLKTLSRLRLAQQRYDGVVDRLVVSVEEIDPINRSGDLFASLRSQAVDAGRRAFALIRARLGNEAIRRAVLRDEHLPEERYRWEPTDAPLFPSLPAGDPSGGGSDGDASGRTPSGGEAEFRTVRRMLLEPSDAKPLAAPDRFVAGPFLLDGKWWAGDERRRYYYARGTGGQLLWLYRDERTGAWTLQGVVD